MKWISSLKMCTPSGKVKKLERIERVSEKIDELKQKAKAAMAKSAEEQASESRSGGGSLLGSLGNLFFHNRDSNRNQEEEKISGLDPEDADMLKGLEKQLESLLTDECLLCGTLYIETLDMPFDSPEEYTWGIF